MKSIASFALSTGLLLAACGPGSRTTGGGKPWPVDEPDLAMASPTDDLAGGFMFSPEGGVDPNPPGPDVCHDEKFTPKKTGDPDIILVQDISGSMSEGNPTKYTQMSKAVSNVLTQLDKQMAPIHWGLLLFPNNGDCGVSNVPEVTVGPGKGAQVANVINGKKPSGNTPATKAIQNAVAYYDTVKDGRSHNILLATDGEPNCENGGGLPKQCMSNKDCAPNEMCQQLLPGFPGFCIPAGGGGGETAKAVAAARAKGIKTYVVGISLGNSATLNALAVEGGTARPGNTKYYDVGDQVALEGALKNITSQIISCTFALNSLPQKNQMIIVTIAGQPVARDPNHMNGWDIDEKAKTLTFYGPACMNLQANPGVVNVGYTCPPPG